MPAAGVLAAVLLALRGVPEGDCSVGSQGFVFNPIVLGFSVSIGPGGELLAEALGD